MRIMILYIVSIILAAVADGYVDEGYKIIGHSAESLSVLMLLIVPFIQKYRGGWVWYIVAYLCLRIGGFDLIYNMIRGLPITFHGSTSLWDIVFMEFNPPVIAELFGRAILLFAGIMIPIQNIK